tara:strand:- start:47 stop:1012 length:966 start_codon:yes stop_codon:yes gene_type:complete
MLDELVTDSSNPQVQLRHSIAIQALSDLANQMPLAFVSGTSIDKISRLKHIRTAQQAVNNALNSLMTEIISECIEDQKDTWKATDGRKSWQGKESEISDVILQAMQSDDIEKVYENLLLGVRYVCNTSVKDMNILAGTLAELKISDESQTTQQHLTWRQQSAFNKGLKHLKTQLLINKIRADVNMTEHPNTFSISTPTAKNNTEQILLHMSEEREGQSYEADFTIVMHIDNLRGSARAWVDDEEKLLIKMLGKGDYGFPQSDVKNPHYNVAVIYEEDIDKLQYAIYSARLENAESAYILFEDFSSLWEIVTTWRKAKKEEE